MHHGAKAEAKVMKDTAKFLLVLAIAMFVGGRGYSREGSQSQLFVDASRFAPVLSPTPDVSQASASNLRAKVTHYDTGFDGDHSLQETIVIEQSFAQYTLYTVRLQFASGSEQSLAIAAPPGGLQPVLRDMSGDNVANDVVLISRLLGLPSIVLLNEGHDHLTVAISPGSFAPSEDRAAGPGQEHHGFTLPASRFRAKTFVRSEGWISPELLANLLSPTASGDPEFAADAGSSGRAPPTLAAQL